MSSTTCTRLIQTGAGWCLTVWVWPFHAQFIALEATRVFPCHEKQTRAAGADGQDAHDAGADDLWCAFCLENIINNNMAGDMPAMLLTGTRYT